VRKYINFVLVVLIIFLTSCSNTGSSLDEGLLTDKPCKAPCWNGLTPGKSTSQDVVQFINVLDTKEWTGNNTFVDKTGCKVVQIADKPGTTVKAFVNFNIEDGELTYIQSFHDHMPKLKQVVAHLGPPEYIEAINVIGPDGSFYALNIFYPEQGVAFKVSVSNKDFGSIKPEMTLSDIQYFEAGELLNYFLAKYACNIGRDGAEKNGLNEIANYIRSWPGFGEVDVINTK